MFLADDFLYILFFLKSMHRCACGKKPIFFQRYDGNYYCEDCLAYSVEKEFNKSLRKLKGRVAVALSGGADSLSLLYLMKKFFRGDFFALSVDEGIQGYRNITLEYAKELTKKLEVKHHIFSFKKEFGMSVDDFPKNIKYCTYCGVLRRYILNKKARELGAKKIAVAHNLDDEAQSILLNFIKGDFSRFQRLGKEPVLIEDEKFVPRIKPLVNISKKKLAIYAIIKDIPFLKNKKCPYSKDNMRKDMQIYINALEKKYPGTKLQIVKFYDKIKSILLEDFKKRKNNIKIKYCNECGEPSSKKICKTCELIKELKNWPNQSSKGKSEDLPT